RVKGEVVAAETHQPAQALTNEIATVGLLLEVALAQRQGQRANRPLTVPAGRRGGQRGARDVRSEHVNRGLSRGESLGREQRERVDLLPARTGGTPHPDGSRPRGLDAPQKAGPRYRVELAAIPEEGRLLVRPLVDQPVQKSAAAHRIRRGPAEGTRIKSRRHSADGGAARALTRRGQRHSRLPEDKFRD